MKINPNAQLKIQLGSDGNPKIYACGTQIYAALAAVQSELKAPKGQMNTFGGYRYRSCEDILEAVKPILKAHDLLLTLSDEPKVLEGWHYIEATAKLESLD